MRCSVLLFYVKIISQIVENIIFFITMYVLGKRKVKNMNIEQLINRVRVRPAMFTGSFLLEPMFYFINGFLYNNAISDKTGYIDKAFQYQFHDWVKIQLEKKHKVKLEDNRNYLTYINKVYQDSEQSLKIFFELCDDFFAEIHNKV